MKPLLQLALDNLSLQDGLNTLQGGVAQAVDIIEAGTLLICAEGVQAVGQLRRLFPEKPLVADFKIADAGSVLGGLIAGQKPDYMTVICAADNGTKAAVKKEADRQGAVVQVELYGRWQMDDVKAWKELGITHVIYHRSRDAAGEWGQTDLACVKALCSMGMDVTVTGGVGYDELELFAGLPIFAIICGRSIRDAADPCGQVLRMKERIDQLWA
ncbi:MAG: orotidine 5'-phosphate decarboxylase [Oscillospiraceae bacterium]|nr:orotidine 5'-phosphate decarboxylase [Oscillospiraceae bacterium]